MKNKTDIEEDVKILNELKNKMDFNSQNDLVLLLNLKEQLAIENILADRERLEIENKEFRDAVNIVNKEKEDWIRGYQEEKDRQFKLLNSYEDLKGKANKYDSLVEKIKEFRNSLEKDGFIGYADELQELLDTEEGE